VIVATIRTDTVEFRTVGDKQSGRGVKFVCHGPRGTRRLPRNA
jgi:hypothetical protein